MEKLEFVAKEKNFLANMNLKGSEEGKEYTAKYGCDPCDACGPSSCSDCSGCAEDVVSIGLNPFKNYKLN